MRADLNSQMKAHNSVPLAVEVSESRVVVTGIDAAYRP